MATPKTGRRRGRPDGTKKDFRADSDRVAVAYAWLLMQLGTTENLAYRTGAWYCVLPVTEITVSEPRETDKKVDILFSLALIPGLPADHDRGTVTRLRKKGNRWRADPDARAYILGLISEIRVIIDRDVRPGDHYADYLANVMRDLRALSTAP